MSRTVSCVSRDRSTAGTGFCGRSYARRGVGRVQTVLNNGFGHAQVSTSQRRALLLAHHRRLRGGESCRLEQLAAGMRGIQS